MGLGKETSKLSEADLPQIRETLFKLKENTAQFTDVVASQTALATGEVDTLVLVDMEGFLTRQPAGTDYNGLLSTLPEQAVGAGEGTIRLEVAIPQGYKVNDLAPFSMEWVSDDPAVGINADDSKQTIVEPQFPLSLTANFTPGQAEVTGELVIYYCEAESESLCLIERVRLSVPVTVTDSAGDGEENTVVVTHVIADPA